MIRITVCDDRQEEVDDIVALCNKYVEEKHLDAVITGTTNPLTVLETKPDALILDIEMPQITGIEIKDQLEEMRNGPYIIFATNYEDSMPDAFGDRVMGFLRKPVEYWELAKRLDRIVTRLTYFTLITFEDGDIINSNDVISISVNRGYSDLSLADGSVKSLVRKSLSTWESELSDYGFIQIDKNCLVNCKYIKNIKDGKVLFDDGSSRKVSYRRRDGCWEQFLEYCKLMAKYA